MTAEVNYRDSNRVLTRRFAVGTTLLRALVELGVEIDAPCGGAGTCGKCRVNASGGLSDPTEEEQALLDPDELRRGVRLACQAKVTGTCTVSAPDERVLTVPAILTEGHREPVAVAPNVHEVEVTLPPQTLERNPSDLEDMVAALAEAGVAGIAVPLRVLRQLPAILRQGDSAVRARIVGNELMHIYPAVEKRPLLGVAVDIGTTTVVGKLFDLRTGHVLAVSARLNAQRAFGEDVIARVQHASRSQAELKTLQERVVGVINEIVADLCHGRGEPSDVAEMVCVGNTVMTHLAVGVTPNWLAQYPYVPAFTGALHSRAGELGIAIDENAHVYFFPGIGRFVGGDTVGVILATGMDSSSGTSLAVDVGTNGELVLSAGGRLVACSTAAGPAFEGAHIRHGMHAATGAIDRVDLADGDIRYHVIGETRPRGVCGSGLIDAVAVLLRAGLVEPSGRLLAPQDLPAGTHEGLRARVQVVGGERVFLLAEGVFLTQGDLREVQLAKGAIAAGARILMRVLGVRPEEIDRVLLAGAFGNFLRRDNAIRIGLLPPVEREKVHFVGNAACAGAEMALLSTEERARAEAVARRVQYIEISAIPDFQDIFAEEMMFPQDEPGRAKR